MLQLKIPNQNSITLEHLLLDLNGTLAVDGTIIPGVKKRLELISKNLMVHLVTCDTHGNGKNIASNLGINLISISPGDEAGQKAKVVERFGKYRTAAIGNGNSDKLMIKNCVLGIVILGTEGLFTETLLNSRIVFPRIIDALDMFLIKERAIATLRG